MGNYQIPMGVRACDVGTTCGEDDGVTVDADAAATRRCGGRAAAAATSNDCNVFLLSIQRPSGKRKAVPAVVLLVGEHKWAFGSATVTGVDTAATIFPSSSSSSTSITRFLL